MRKFIASTSVIASAIIFCSCAGEAKKSDTLESEDISPRYRVNYNNDHSGSITADFLAGAKWDYNEEEKTGGDAVEFSGNANVTCNGITLSKDKDIFTGVYYKGDFPSGKDSVIIVWTDNEGKTFRAAGKMNDITLVAPESKILKDNGWKIEWTGSPLLPGEKVVVQIRGKVNKKDKTISETITEPGATSVDISSSALSDFDGVQVKVTAWREQIIRVSNTGSADGSLKLKCEAKDFTTKIFTRKGSFTSFF